MKYLLPILTCGLLLSACDNNTGSTASNQGSSDVSISYANTIPVLSAKANNQLSVMLYNDSDKALTNANYSVGDVYYNGQIVSRYNYDITVAANSCSTIQSHSSCKLSLISQGVLPANYVASGILQMSYTINGTTGTQSTLLNLRSYDATSFDNIQIAGTESELTTSSKYTTIYLIAGSSVDNVDASFHNLSISTTSSNFTPLDSLPTTMQAGDIYPLTYRNNNLTESSYDDISLSSEQNNSIKQARVKLQAVAGGNAAILVMSNTPVLSNSGTYSLTVFNTGGATTTSAPTAASSDATVFGVSGCGSNIAAYTSCTLTITPTTTANAQSSATLTVTYNTSNTLKTTITVNPKATYRAAAIWTTGTVACESSVTAYLALNIKNIGTESLVINSSNAASIITGNEGTGTSFFSWVESQNTTTCSGLTAGNTCIINAAYQCINNQVESTINWRATLTLAESSNLKLSTIVTTSNWNQVGTWTWIGGASTTSGAASYGSQGVGASANIPAAGYMPGFASDDNGNLYLLGGSNGTYIFNTLWKYNVATGYWAYLTGSTTNATIASAIGGAKGVESATYTPSSTYIDAMAYDESGYLWEYGGLVGSTYCNSLWRYNPITNKWAWMNGYTISCVSTVYTGNFGSKGTEITANLPPALYGMTLTADKHGSLWLFGGTDSTYYYNTMWRYSESTQLWTWIAGTGSGGGGSASGGATGAEATTYTPLPVYLSASTLDESGNIWVFGGHSGTWVQNGFWRFNTNTRMWAWISGTQSASSAVVSVAGGTGVESASYTPSARQYPMMWYDKHGYIWLLGGYGYSTLATIGQLSDLWRYNIATKQWAWMKGINNSAGNTGANMGTKNQININNVMGSRGGGAVLYYNNYAYQFGGMGSDVAATNGYLNTFSRTKLYTN